MKRFRILSLFPASLEHYFDSSMLKKASEKGLVDIKCVDIRDFADNKHRRVDDAPFGGGYGMILMCQPVVDCIRHTKAHLPEGKTIVIYTSPQGALYNQEKAHSLVEYDNIIILCGHYEGIDERIIELEVDEEISVGDYVLTGGELPAAIITDSVTRLIDGVLPSDECFTDESFGDGLLEYAQYTRPRVFEGLEVPEVLINGNHKKQQEWKHSQKVERTKNKRPDLLEKKI